MEPLQIRLFSLKLIKSGAFFTEKNMVLPPDNGTKHKPYFLNLEETFKIKENTTKHIWILFVNQDRHRRTRALKRNSTNTKVYGSDSPLADIFPNIDPTTKQNWNHGLVTWNRQCFFLRQVSQEIKMQTSIIALTKQSLAS